MNWFEKHWEAIAVGGGVGLVGLFLRSKTASASTTSSTTTPTSTSTDFVYTLVSGQSVFAYQARIGQTITIKLPAGASWTGQSSSTGSPVATLTGSAPITWVYQGPGAVSWTWIDAGSMPQTTTGTFDNVPGV